MRVPGAGIEEHGNEPEPHDGRQDTVEFGGERDQHQDSVPFLQSRAGELGSPLGAALLQLGECDGPPPSPTPLNEGERVRPGCGLLLEKPDDVHSGRPKRA